MEKRELLRRITVECQRRGLAKVSTSAVDARIATISPRELIRRREGGREAKERFDLIRSHYLVENPLDVMQIDHTPMDLFVVDLNSGTVLGRPVLTICTDVASRVICGFRIGMERPSSVTLQRAFSSAVQPKPAQLDALGITVHWPVFGIPTAVHSDNGSDLTSNAFQSGLIEYGIVHIRRYLGCPEMGGHVERLIGTLNSHLHSLPGTTRSNVADRGARDPRNLACLTLPELRRIVVSYLCNVYHRTRHEGLKDTPLRVWERYWAQHDDAPRLPADMATFDRAFWPFETRKITKYGIRFRHLYYRSRDLQKMRDCGVETVRFRYDPDDLRHIHAEVGQGATVEIPCETRFHQPISFAEHALLRGEADTNTHRWSDADLLRHYQLHDEIISKAKARKKAHRKVANGQRPSSDGALQPSALKWLGQGARDEL